MAKLEYDFQAPWAPQCHVHQLWMPIHYCSHSCHFLECPWSQQHPQLVHQTTATAIDVNRFTLNIETWGDTTLYSAQACCVAYPEDEIVHLSTRWTFIPFTGHSSDKAKHSTITFNNVEFWKDPTVFIALNSINIDHKANLRIASTPASKVSPRLAYGFLGWHRSLFRWSYHHCIQRVIAIRPLSISLCRRSFSCVNVNCECDPECEQ